MGNAGVALAVILVVTWGLQMALSILQVKRYFKRVNALRRLGRVASGMAGGRYRGRTYGILAVDPATKQIMRAEQLAGITVFASPKPVPQLAGISLDALIDDPSALADLSPRSADAFRAAARTLRESFLTAVAPAESGDHHASAAALSEPPSVPAGALAPAGPIPPKSTRTAPTGRRRHAPALRSVARTALRLMKE